MNEPPRDEVPVAGSSAARRAVNSFPESVFIGPVGLRAGWRLGIYFGGFYFIANAVSFIVAPLVSHLPDNPIEPSIEFLLSECIQLFAAIIPAIFLARLEQRPFGVYGLPLSGFFEKYFWIGIVWGILSLTALLIILRAIGAFYFGRLAIHGLRAWKYAVFWGVLFLFVALYEEFFTRGYAQFTLTTGIGFWPAAGIISVVFGASHLRNPGENWSGALGAALIGLFWCFTLRRTGSLWFGVGMHAAWDWGESFLYSVPDSGLIAPGHLLKSSFHGPNWLTGGPVGPEGSVLLIILIAALWTLFARLHPEVKYDSNLRVHATPRTNLLP